MIFEPGLSEALSEQLQSHTGAAFEQPYGLSFDSSGNLFVADPLGRAGKASIIDKFDANGAFLAQLGASTLVGEFVRSAPVSDKTGDIYAAEAHPLGESPNSEVVVLNSAGELLSRWTGEKTPAGSFGKACCLLYGAVDNSSSVSAGDVYVMTPQLGLQPSEVTVLEPQNGGKEEGKFVRGLESPEGFHFQGEAGLAVSETNGQVYVVDTANRVVDRFSATGEFEASGQIKGPAEGEEFADPIAVAVDGATGNVFVIDHGKGHSLTKGETIYEFNAAGELLNEITETKPGEPLEHPIALAVQRTGPHAGDLYVSDIDKKRIDVFAPEPLEPPSIAGVAVTEVTADTASFAAEINPQGTTTTYRFEYGRCPSPNACASSPFELRLPEVGEFSLAGEDFAVHSTTAVPVRKLSGSTIYHLRVIARNANGESTSERIFMTQGPGGTLDLPDGRDWELVSPPDKHAAALLTPGELGLIQAAADGSAISYLANAPTEPAPEGDVGEVQVLSRRTPSGWSSKDLAAPHEAATGYSHSHGIAPEYRYFSEDLSHAVVQPLGLFNPTLSGEASEQTPYLRTLTGCEANCYRPFVTGKVPFANVAEGTRFGEELLCEENNGIHSVVETVCGPRIVGGSADASHFVLRSAAPLQGGLPRNELYEWLGGQLILISILPPDGKGEELPAPTVAGAGGEPLLGSGFGFAKGTVRRAISSDGSRVFWESGGALYVRDTVRGKSLQLDAAEPKCIMESKCESAAGRFQIASADGSHVYFTDARRLTKDAGATSAEPDLYECRIVDEGGNLACALRDLTPSEAGKGADVQGDVLGASEGGASIYFVADGTLGTEAERGTCVNQGENPQTPGATCNLYVMHNGVARLVARLSGQDAKDWTETNEFQPTRVSPNGRYLAFMSAASLTGYDNRDAVSGKRDAEAYLYDAAGEGSLGCASCNPNGARPSGVEYGRLVSKASQALPAVREEWEKAGWLAALLPHTAAIAFSSPTYQPRYLNNQGRLFFNSLDALLPQDVNGTGDVYEYEPTGVGSCSTPNALPGVPGCIGLISSGTSPETSAFLDASESGDDVFFLTAQQLTSDDVDTREDVYDAHVCSSASPCISPRPKPPAPCSEESTCRSAPASQPSIFSAPLSSTYSGPGNPALPPPTPPTTPKPPTKAQLLAKALKQCRKRYPNAKASGLRTRRSQAKRRQACERQARAKYSAKKSSKPKGKKSSKPKSK